MSQFLGYGLRIILEYLLFVGIYYLLLTRWLKNPKGESFRNSAIVGIIWIFVYELVLYLWH